MKKFLMIFFFCLIGFSPASASQHRDQLDHLSCSYCGMDRTKFGHSRMLVKYQDGGEVGTCSLHCLALEFANAIDRVPKQILVADYSSGDLVDAEQATWVLGGNQQGVMTSRAKWAFAERSTAERFIAEHGGEITDFDQAIKASYEDMYQDTQRIRKMRAMKNKVMAPVKMQPHK